MSKQPKLEAGQVWCREDGFEIYIGHDIDGTRLVLFGTSNIGELNDEIIGEVLSKLGMTLVPPTK